VRVYPGESLFDMIDGGADVFFEYGFRRAGTARYVRDGGEAVRADLYEMTDPLSAFGVFSYMAASTGSAVRIGQEAVAGDNFVICWKGTYVGTATALNGGTRADALGIVSLIDSCLPPGGSVPELVLRLRRDPARLSDVVFVRGVLGLFRHADFDPSDILPPGGGAVATADSCWLLAVPCEELPGCEETLQRARRADGVASWVRDPSLDTPGVVGGRRGNQTMLLARTGGYLVLVAGADPRRVHTVLERAAPIQSEP
jgi:hypothetical protein